MKSKVHGRTKSTFNSPIISAPVHTRPQLSEAETGSGKTVAYLLPMLVHAIAQPLNPEIWRPSAQWDKKCRTNPKLGQNYVKSSLWTSYLIIGRLSNCRRENYSVTWNLFRQFRAIPCNLTHGYKCCNASMQLFKNHRPCEAARYSRFCIGHRESWIVFV